MTIKVALLHFPVMRFANYVDDGLT